MRSITSLWIPALLIAATAGTSAAGPNAGGTLIIHTPEIAYCGDDSEGYCGDFGMPLSCEEATAILPQSDFSYLFLVLAAFAPTQAPRLSGVAFGVVYDESHIFLTGAQSCGDFEIATDGWPGSGSGTAVTWNTAQTDILTKVYTFAGYEYYGLVGYVALTSHPTQGAVFADDSIPSEIDPIAALGTLGFNGYPGDVPCPGHPPLPGACCLPDCSCEVLHEPDCHAAGGDWYGEGVVCDPNPCSCPETGACCFPDMSCSIRSQAECDEAGGFYMGGGTLCDPNPCPTPVQDSSWGKVKSLFR